MDHYDGEYTPYKKRSKKKSPKKSNHKHEYVLVEKEPMIVSGWFNYKKECKICGKVYTELHIDREDITE